jgi:hypothetical protein
VRIVALAPLDATTATLTESNPLHAQQTDVTLPHDPLAARTPPPHAHRSQGSLALANLGSSASSPMCFKIRSITARSLITAMNRIRPPQPVQVSASNPQTRFSRVAQSHVVNAICCTAATPADGERTLRSPPAMSPRATTVSSWLAFKLTERFANVRAFSA